MLRRRAGRSVAASSRDGHERGGGRSGGEGGCGRADLRAGMRSLHGGRYGDAAVFRLRMQGRSATTAQRPFGRNPIAAGRTLHGDAPDTPVTPDPVHRRAGARPTARLHSGPVRGPEIRVTAIRPTIRRDGFRRARWAARPGCRTGPRAGKPGSRRLSPGRCTPRPPPRVCARGGGCGAGTPVTRNGARSTARRSRAGAARTVPRLRRSASRRRTSRPGT